LASTRADQVVLRLVRHPDRRQIAAAQQARQLEGVAAIGRTGISDGAGQASRIEPS
jgi:hypothetical protein